MRTKTTSIPQYILQCPPQARPKLREMRALLKKLVPAAQEKISYGIPTYFLHGNLVHFGGYAKHIGFYPGAAVIAAFTKDLARFTHAKGSVQFPLDQPLPRALITKMVRLSVQLSKQK